MVNKKDLTRIEDLSDFLHEDDPDTNALLEERNEEEEKEGELDPPLPYQGLDEALDREDEDENQIETDEDDLFGAEEAEEPIADFVSDSEIEFGSDVETEFDSESEFETESDSELDFGSDSEIDFETTADLDSETDLVPELETETTPEFETETTPELETETTPEFETEITPEFETETTPELVAETEPESGPKTQEEQQEIDDLTDKEISTKLDHPEAKISETSKEKIDQLEKTNTRSSDQHIKEISKFAEKMVYGKITASGKPAFSIKLTQIKFQEDADSILSILREHEFLTPENEKIFKDSLKNGAILIGHISEYAAIYLCHRFRRFDLQMNIGPAEEIHKSNSYTKDSFSPVSKRDVFNRTTKERIIEKEDEFNQKIISSNGPLIANHKIIKHLLSASAHKLIPVQIIDENIENKIDQYYSETLKLLEQKVNNHAGNAIINLDFKLEILSSTQDNYQLTCSGDIVLVETI